MNKTDLILAGAELDAQIAQDSKIDRLQQRKQEKLDRLSSTKSIPVVGAYDADSVEITNPYIGSRGNEVTTARLTSSDGYGINAPELKDEQGNLTQEGINARIQADSYIMGVDAPNFPEGEGLDPKYYDTYKEHMDPALAHRSISGEFRAIPTGKSGYYDRDLYLGQSKEMDGDMADYLVSKGQAEKVNYPEYLDKPSSRYGEGVEPKSNNFLEAIKQRESSGNYKEINEYGYLGGYQFGAARLQDLGLVKPGTKNEDLANPEVWTGAYGVRSREEFLNNSEVQDRVAIDHFKDLEAQLAPIATSSEDLYGKMAAAHLLGVQGSKDLSRTDANQTSGQEYYELGSQFGRPTERTNRDYDNRLGESIDMAQGAVAKFGADAVKMLDNVSTKVLGKDNVEKVNSWLDKMDKFLGGDGKAGLVIEEDGKIVDPSGNLKNVYDYRDLQAAQREFGVREDTLIAHQEAMTESEELWDKAETIPEYLESMLVAGSQLDRILAGSAGEILGIGVPAVGIPMTAAIRTSNYAEEYEKNNDKPMSPAKLAETFGGQLLVLGGEKLLIRSGVGSLLSKRVGKSPLLGRVGTVVGSGIGEAGQEFAEAVTEEWATQKEGARDLEDIITDKQNLYQGAVGFVMGAPLRAGGETVGVAKDKLTSSMIKREMERRAKAKVPNEPTTEAPVEETTEVSTEIPPVEPMTAEEVEALKQRTRNHHARMQKVADVNSPEVATEEDYQEVLALYKEWNGRAKDEVDSKTKENIDKFLKDTNTLLINDLGKSGRDLVLGSKEDVFNLIQLVGESLPKNTPNRELILDNITKAATKVGIDKETVQKTFNEVEQEAKFGTRGYATMGALLNELRKEPKANTAKIKEISDNLTRFRDTQIKYVAKAQTAINNINKDIKEGKISEENGYKQTKDGRWYKEEPSIPTTGKSGFRFYLDGVDSISDRSLVNIETKKDNIAKIDSILDGAPVETVKSKKKSDKEFRAIVKRRIDKLLEEGKSIEQIKSTITKAKIPEINKKVSLEVLEQYNTTKDSNIPEEKLEAEVEKVASKPVKKDGTESKKSKVNQVEVSSKIRELDKNLINLEEERISLEEELSVQESKKEEFIEKEEKASGTTKSNYKGWVTRIDKTIKKLEEKLLAIDSEMSKLDGELKETVSTRKEIDKTLKREKEKSAKAMLEGKFSGESSKESNIEVAKNKVGRFNSDKLIGSVRNRFIAMLNSVSRVLNNQVLTGKETAKYLKGSPALLLLGKDGRFPREVEEAITLAIIDYQASRLADIANPDERQVRALLRLPDSTRVTNKMLKAARNVGKYADNEAAGLGDFIYKYLPITTGAESDVTFEARLKADLGRYALIVMEKRGVLEHFTMTPNQLNKRFGGVATVDTETANSAKHFYRLSSSMLASSDKQVINSRGKKISLREYSKRMDNAKALLDGISEQAEIGSNITRPRKFKYKESREVKARRMEAVMDIPERQQKAINIAENTAIELNLEAIDRFAKLWDKDEGKHRERILKILGWVDTSTVHTSFVSNYESNNRAIEEGIEELLTFRYKTGSDRFYFNYFFSKNGRLFIDSTKINPQNNKFHRFLFNVAKGKHTIRDSSSRNEFKLAVVQAFDGSSEIDKKKDTTDKEVAVEGFVVKKLGAIDKQSPEDSYRDFESIVSNPLVQKAINGNDNALLKLLEGADHPSHLIAAVEALKDYKEGESFKTKLTLEVDSVNSGFALGNVINPVLTWDKLKDVLAGVGIWIGENNPNKTYGEWKGKGGKDSYERGVEKVNDTIDKSQPIYGLLGDVVRNTMKYPLVIFVYGGGISGITRGITQDMMMEYMNNFSDAKQFSMYRKNTIAILKAELAKAEGNDNLKWKANKIKKAIVWLNKADNETIRTSSIDETGEMKFIYDLVSYNVNNVYGKPIGKYLSEEYKELVSLRDSISSVFAGSFNVFKKELDSRLAKIKEKNNYISKKDYQVILDSMVKEGLVPGIFTVDSKKPSEKVAILDTMKMSGGSDVRVSSSIPNSGNRVVNPRIVDYVMKPTSANVSNIHTFDGGLISSLVTDKLGIGIHDALVSLAGLATKSSKLYNKELIERALDFNMAEQVRDLGAEAIGKDIKVFEEGILESLLDKYGQINTEVWKKVLIGMNKKGTEEYYDGLKREILKSSIPATAKKKIIKILNNKSVSNKDIKTIVDGLIDKVVFGKEKKNKLIDTIEEKTLDTVVSIVLSNSLPKNTINNIVTEYRTALNWNKILDKSITIINENKAKIREEGATVNNMAGPEGSAYVLEGKISSKTTDELEENKTSYIHPNDEILEIPSEDVFEDEPTINDNHYEWKRKGLEESVNYYRLKYPDSLLKKGVGVYNFLLRDIAIDSSDEGDIQDFVDMVREYTGSKLLEDLGVKVLTLNNTLVSSKKRTLKEWKSILEEIEKTELEYLNEVLRFVRSKFPENKNEIYINKGNIFTGKDSVAMVAKSKVLYDKGNTKATYSKISKEMDAIVEELGASGVDIDTVLKDLQKNSERCN